MLSEIFGAFREARKIDGQTAFLMLQDKIAEHAGDLIRLDLSSMKELVDLLMKLNEARKDEGESEKSNESALQRFLRGATDQTEGMTQ